MNALSQARASGGGGTGCTTPPAPTSDTKCYFGSGCLDSSFGSVGYVVGTSLPANGIVEVNDMLVQPDGRVLIFGMGVEPSSDTDLVVGRLNPDGSFDTTFGDVDLNNPLQRRGFTLIDVTGGNENGTAGALLADGRIVIAGYRDADTAVVAQLNPDGTPDTSFGSTGRVTFQYRFIRVRDLAVQSDGKILLVGGELAYTVARLNGNGSFDTSFGTAGIASINPSSVSKGSGTGRTAEIQRITVGSTIEERLVVAGYMRDKPVGVDRFGFIRLTTAGALDTSFGTAGRSSVSFTEGRGEVNDIAIDSSNRIVAAGFVEASCRGVNHAFVRLSANGIFDSSFGTGGKVVYDVYGGDDRAHALVIQPDGKIVTAGQAAATGYGPDFVVTRFLANGSLDSGFGPGLPGYFPSGIVTTNTALQDLGKTIALRSDGRILVAGTARDTTGTFAAAMYLP